MNTQYAQDRPVGQRERRHHLHARRVGPDDRGHDDGGEPDDGRPRQRVPVRQNMQGPIRMMAEQTGGMAADQHERLEGQPRPDRGGLLQLLLARLPQRARGRRPAAPDRGLGQAQGPDRAHAHELRREVRRDADRRGGRREPAATRAPTTRSRPASPSATRSPTTGRTTCLPVRDLGADRQARAGAVRRPVRGAVLRLLRGAATPRATSPTCRSSGSRCSIPAKDFDAAQRKDFYYDAS